MKISKNYITWIAPIMAVLLFFSMASADFTNDGKKEDCESKVGVQSVPSDYDCSQRDAVNPLAWASDNPKTIDRSASITVSVTGGKPPYTWTVAGTDFEFAKESTTDLVNQLLAGSTACGVASVTVTEKEGQQVTAYIRCSTGHWDALWGSTGCGNSPVDWIYVDCDNRARWALRVSQYQNCDCWCIFSGKNYNPIPARGWCTSYKHNFGQGCNWCMSDLCGYHCEGWICP